MEAPKTPQEALAGLLRAWGDNAPQAALGGADGPLDEREQLACLEALRRASPAQLCRMALHIYEDAMTVRQGAKGQDLTPSHPSALAALKFAGECWERVRQLTETRGQSTG